MTTEVDDIVRVNITQESSAVSRAGFNTLLVIPAAAHAVFAGRTQEFSGSSILQDMVTAGFAETDQAYLQASAALAQRPRHSKIKVGRIDAADANLTASMNAIEAEDPDFYGFVHGSRAEADILELAAWTESNGRHLYGAQTEDAAVTAETAGNVLEDLEGQAYRRTHLTFHDPNTEDYFDAAWSARGLIADLDVRNGQITWANKTLSGISAANVSGSYTLTGAQRSYIHGLNGNTYERRMGRNITRNGTLADGEFIDVQVGIDWLDNRMTEDVFAAIAGTATRIPMSQAGINTIELIVRKRLQLAVDNGILLDYSVEVPTFEEVSTSDRATRLLRNVSFSGTIAGAIHTVQMEGRVSV